MHDQDLYKSPAIEVYGHCRLLLPWLRVDFVCNPGLKNWWLSRGLIPHLGAFDLSITNSGFAIGGTGTAITQCSRAVVYTKKALPVQVDGEPCLMRPCKVEISLDKRFSQPARMLMKNKNGSCKLTTFYHYLFLNWAYLFAKLNHLLNTTMYIISRRGPQMIGTANITIMYNIFIRA